MVFFFLLSFFIAKIWLNFLSEGWQFAIRVFLFQFFDIKVLQTSPLPSPPHKGEKLVKFKLEINKNLKNSQYFCWEKEKACRKRKHWLELKRQNLGSLKLKTNKLIIHKPWCLITLVRSRPQSLSGNNSLLLCRNIWRQKEDHMLTTWDLIILQFWRRCLLDHMNYRQIIAYIAFGGKKKKKTNLIFIIFIESSINFFFNSI